MDENGGKTKSKRSATQEKIQFDKQAKIVSVIGNKFECNTDTVIEDIKKLSEDYEGIINELVEYVNRYLKNPGEHNVKQALDYVDDVQVLKKYCDGILNDFDKMKK